MLDAALAPLPFVDKLRRTANGREEPTLGSTHWHLRLPSTPRRRTRGTVHAFFEVGVILKGLDALLEVVGAVVLLFVSPAQIHRGVISLTQHELSEDPHDVVATHLVRAVSHLSRSGKHFAFLYLLSHGVLKLGLVWALLKTKLWAYPVAIAIFVLFGLYQMYRFALSHSPGMVALTILDAFVIILTWLEYRRLRAMG